MAAVTTVPGIGVRSCPSGHRAPARVATPRARRATPATYRRRRVVVAALALGVVVVAAQAGAALGGSPLAAPERRPASSSTTRRVVVQPGDTLWSIATRLAPDDDPRPVVDAVAKALHRTTLVTGETISWPR